MGIKFFFVLKSTWVLNSPLCWKTYKNQEWLALNNPLSSPPTCPCVPHSFTYLGKCICGLSYSSKRSKKCHEKMFASAPAHIYTGTKIKNTLLLSQSTRYIPEMAFLQPPPIYRSCLLPWLLHSPSVAPWSSWTAVIALDIPFSSILAATMRKKHTHVRGSRF